MLGKPKTNASQWYMFVILAETERWPWDQGHVSSHPVLHPEFQSSPSYKVVRPYLTYGNTVKWMQAVQFSIGQIKALKIFVKVESKHHGQEKDNRRWWGNEGNWLHYQNMFTWKCHDKPTIMCNQYALLFFFFGLVFNFRKDLLYVRPHKTALLFPSS